ncbi:hypothetical protein QR680_000487 [Steinernema hermaphroditum]|uniref:Domain of unknown function DB domain-containing protein n=1 Tax=Steinernema hermaphroditum TaxID=289476 RepID=A0AA39GUY7_9BILA|nr:hypothetical protein QR680_000487 [Steinernema hermaphroditum]
MYSVLLLLLAVLFSPQVFSVEPSHDSKCIERIMVDICDNKTRAIALEAFCTRSGYFYACFAESSYTSPNLQLELLAADMCCGKTCDPQQLYDEVCCPADDRQCNYSCYANAHLLEGRTYTFPSNRDRYCN